MSAASASPTVTLPPEATTPQPPLRSLPSARQVQMLTLIANAVARSGIGDRRPERNFAIFLKGLEVGIPPMEALESITAGDDGKMSLSAGLMHAKLLESRKGRIQWLERTPERVTGRFIRFDDEANPVDITWSMAEEATDAGLASRATYKKYPRQLLTARVISEGMGLVFPDVVTARSYTPDELGDASDTGIDLDAVKFDDTTPPRFRGAASEATAPAQTPLVEVPPAATAAAARAEALPAAAPALAAEAPASAPPAAAGSLDDPAPLDALATLTTLVKWAGFSADEWKAVLKPYGVVSARQLAPAQLHELMQSIFDRFTPFELRAAGMPLAAIRAAGFSIPEGASESLQGKADSRPAARSTSLQTSSSSATAPLAA